MLDNQVLSPRSLSIWGGLGWGNLGLGLKRGMSSTMLAPYVVHTEWKIFRHWVSIDIEKLQSLVTEENMKIAMEKLKNELHAPKNAMESTRQKTQNTALDVLENKALTHSKSSNTEEERSEAYLRYFNIVVQNINKFKIPKEVSTAWQTYMLIGLGVLLTAFTTIWVLQPKKLTQADFDKVNIEILHISKNPKGTATVEVAYDASHLGNDLEKYNISFGTSVHTNATPVKISKPIDTLTLTYEVAGRHFIALGNGKFTKHHDFVLEAPDWFANARKSRKWVGKMFLKDDIAQNGHFAFPEEKIKADFKDNFDTYYQYTKPIPASLNDFTMEVRLKLQEPKEFSDEAYGNVLHLIDKNEEIALSFAMFNVGAGTMWVWERFGKTQIFRDTKSLAFLERFTCPLEELQDWQTMKIKVHHRQVWCYFNDRLIYTQKVEKFEGNIETTEINCKSVGVLDYVRVWNDEGKLVYREEFNAF